MEDTAMEGVAALFDLDGVLVDSEGLYTGFWDDMSRDHRLPSPTFAHDIKGSTLKEILDIHFPDPQARAAIVEQIHKFENEAIYPIMPGVYRFVRSLREHGIRTAVVTSSDNVKMSCLCAQHPEFRGYFDDVIDGSQVTRSKPDPEGYIMAAKRLGCAIGNCYVFEDSYKGLEAGRRSGATVIGLATTYTRESIEGKADAVIDGFDGFTMEDMLGVVRAEAK
ncbi:MAG: HAD family phosphatase [Bacteroidales bacterium]|nr:HAD family phosphatase [Bacteroidales bacterium]